MKSILFLTFFAPILCFGQFTKEDHIERARSQCMYSLDKAILNYEAALKIDPLDTRTHVKMVNCLHSAITYTSKDARIYNLIDSVFALALSVDSSFGPTFHLNMYEITMNKVKMQSAPRGLRLSPEDLIAELSIALNHVEQLRILNPTHFDDYDFKIAAIKRQITDLRLQQSGY